METALSSIASLAEEISYDELEPLFNTAAKKVGTRIGVMVALRVLLEKGQEKTSAAAEFIANGKADDNEILRAEAENIG